MSTATARKIADQTEAAETLRELFPIGSAVSVKLLHVSRSGMLRSFAVLAANSNGTIRDVSHLVIRAGGFREHKPTGGVAMGGCGMDMGFALVYSLAHSLYAGGFLCTGVGWLPRHVLLCEPCPSNDHSNERTPDYRAGRIHSDSGYALRHRWI